MRPGYRGEYGKLFSASPPLVSPFPEILWIFLPLIPGPRTFCVWGYWPESWERAEKAVFHLEEIYEVPYILLREGMERDFGCANFNPNDCMISQEEAALLNRPFRARTNVKTHGWEGVAHTFDVIDQVLDEPQLGHI
jgi:hypothetical protein